MHLRAPAAQFHLRAQTPIPRAKARNTKEKHSTMIIIDLKAYRDRQELPETPLNHPLVAKKLGELMRLAAEHGLPNEPKAPSREIKK